MNKVLLLAVSLLLCFNQSQAQHRRHAKPAKTIRAVPPPAAPSPKVLVPEERGRTVMQEQISNSGAVIVTPVPKPKKVVVVPAPPPPGNTMTPAPAKR